MRAGGARCGCVQHADTYITSRPAPRSLGRGWPWPFSCTHLLLLLRSAPARRSCTASASADCVRAHASAGLLPALQKNRDKYGRVVGVCSLNGEDLNGWLVEQGLAVAYRWVLLRPLGLLVCNLTSVPGCGGGLPGWRCAVAGAAECGPRSTSHQGCCVWQAAGPPATHPCRPRS